MEQNFSMKELYSFEIIANSSFNINDRIFEKDEVVGVIGLKKDLVESYMILDMMQVSASYRGRGIGRKLFDEGKKEARKADAEALYISACSSEETIVFYKAMGAELTDCPIKEIAESEPYDLQMICSV